MIVHYYKQGKLSTTIQTQQAITPSSLGKSLDGYLLLKTR